MTRLLFILALLAAPLAQAAIPAAPDRREGEGPYPQLILRGVTVVTGTGAPAYGPVDIVIEGNRITRVQIVGSANAPIDPQWFASIASPGWQQRWLENFTANQAGGNATEDLVQDGWTEIIGIDSAASGTIWVGMAIQS